MIQSSPLLLGAGAQARDVGAAGGLGEQLAPDLLAGGQRRQIFALLLLARKRHHGRPAHAVADDEHRAQLAEGALLLLPDHALDRRRAAAAIFLRPVQAGPAGIGFLLLPGLCDFEDVGVLERRAAERGFAQLLLILLRRIGRDPGLGLGAERGFLRRVVEVHACLFLSFRGARSANYDAQLHIRESRSTTSRFRVCASRIPE